MRSLEDVLTFTKFERIHFNNNSGSKRVLKRALELELVVEITIGKRRFFEVVDEQELLLLYPEIMVTKKIKDKYQKMIDSDEKAIDRHNRLQKILISNKWNNKINFDEGKDD